MNYWCLSQLECCPMLRKEMALFEKNTVNWELLNSFFLSLKHSGYLSLCTHVQLLFFKFNQSLTISMGSSPLLLKAPQIWTIKHLRYDVSHICIVFKCLLYSFLIWWVDVIFSLYYSKENMSMHWGFKMKCAISSCTIYYYEDDGDLSVC